MFLAEFKNPFSIKALFQCMVSTFDLPELHIFRSVSDVYINSPHLLLFALSIVGD